MCQTVIYHANMTSAFINYVNEGAQHLIGHAQETAAGEEGTRNQRSDVANTDNGNIDSGSDMLALHLNLTRQLTRNKNKDYNRKSLWVVTFFTIVRNHFTRPDTNKMT